MINFRRLVGPSSVNIERARDEIDETIFPPAKARLMDRVINRVNSEAGRAGKRTAHLRDHLAGLDGHPGLEPGAEIESRGNLSLAATFSVVDIPLQFMLNRAQFKTLNTPAVLVLAAAIVIGVG